MSTSSHLAPRRGAGALAALAVAGTALLGAPAAVAAPGDNGDVKVHDANTPFDDQRDDPKVCHFYLDGFNFDGGQRIAWSIATQPHVAGGATLAGTLFTSATGRGRTGDLTLPDGQYKVTWNLQGANGAGKTKVFKVDCPVSAPTPSPSTTGGPSTSPGQQGGPGGPGGGTGPSRTGAPGAPGGQQGGPGRPGGPVGPNGGPPAGGGGLAHAQNFSPVAGAAAAGLVVAGGVVFLRLRRRGNGAA
ncbi:hypothetical protein [Streptomyces sp. NPDC002516]